MINFLRIKNFQSHKKTELRLSRGVNTITGKTDSGKSAVFRALKWLITNKPSGESFKRKGGKIVEVSAVKKKIVIGRQKSKENLYFINDKKYKSFGGGVPNDISKLLNISEANLQPQMSLPFLLSQSSGEVARYLNDVINLSHIDQAFSKLISSIRRGKIEIEIKKQDRKKTKKDLKQYRNLDEVDVRLLGLETLQKEIALINTKRKEITRTLKNIRKVKRKIEQLQTLNLERAKEQLLLLKRELKSLSVSKRKYKVIKSLIGKNSWLTKIIKSKEELLNKLEILFAKSKPRTCPLCGRSSGIVFPNKGD